MGVAGFLLEKGLFAVMDWPQGIGDGHLFSSSGQVHLIVAEYLTRFLAWSAAGFLIGAGFYRSEESGGLALAVGWIPVTITEFVMGTQSGSPIVMLRFAWDPPSVHPVIILAVAAVSYVVTVALAWRVVRDIPTRSKSA